METKLDEETRSQILSKQYNHDWGLDGFCTHGCKTHFMDFVKNNLCKVKIKDTKIIVTGSVFCHMCQYILSGVSKDLSILSVSPMFSHGILFASLFSQFKLFCGV